MKEKLRKFMMGRYGADELTRFLLYVGMVFLVIDLFIRNRWFLLIPVLLMALCYIRIFSKNHRRRYEENQAFLKYKKRFLKVLHGAKPDKNNHIYRCPSCRQKIRIPAGKGRIEIACPKCGKKFIKKS